MLDCGSKHQILNNLQILKHHERDCQVSTGGADVIDMKMKECTTFHAPKPFGPFKIFY